jgi:uncharacterized protein YceK
MNLRLLLPVMALLSLEGCIVVRDRTAAKAKPAARECHPSEYWDGTQCRHKGKGNGARKHDH